MIYYTHQQQTQNQTQSSTNVISEVMEAGIELSNIGTNTTCASTNQTSSSAHFSVAGEITNSTAEIIAEVGETLLEGIENTSEAGGSILDGIIGTVVEGICDIFDF